MRPLNIHCQEAVRRAPDDVWAYVADGYFTNHGSWDPAIVGMRKLTDGAIAKGTRGEETRRFGGTQRALFEITEFERSTRFALRNTSGPFVVDRAYTLTSHPDGTLISFDFRMAPKGPVRLLFPLVRRTIERQVRANIGRIPGLL